MITTATATATSTMVAAIGWTILGGITLFVLVAALVAKEVTRFSGNDRLFRLQRALSIAIVPLAMATVVVLVQQYTSLA
jgi:hypothetical protein